MPEEKQETIEIPEVEETKEETFNTEGLGEDELALAEKHGLVEEKEKKDGELEVDTEPETEDNKEEKEEVDDKPKTFEEVEQDENKLKKFNPNEQALYWKYKSDKKKRQAAQKQYEELKAEYELSQVKDSSYGRKLNKIKEALSGSEVTIEQLQAIIGETKAEESDDNAPLTKAEFKKLKSEEEKSQKEINQLKAEQSERIADAESIGKAKYANFEEITKWASEVVDSDKTGTYKSVLNAAFSDKEVDEEQLVERVVTIAKLNPNFGKESSAKEEKEVKDTNATRAIKNSKKKVSSAAVGSGGKRIIAYDDLTPDDAARLTTKQWQELPEKVRERILMES